MTIDTAFLVCAGLGTRMKPLTDTCPKPLCPIAGRPVLDYIFDHLRATDVYKVTVNSHHLPQQISDFLQTIPDFALTEKFEPVLLETGGGLVNALDTLSDKPFFMINGDAFWTDDKGHNTLTELENHFDADKMDILLCMTPIARMVLTEGTGDYDVLPNGQLQRRKDKSGAYMFTGIRILNPKIMEGFTADKFSFLKNMDEAEEKGRLYGFIMNGDWHHISTPEDLKNVENHLEANKAKD